MAEVTVNTNTYELQRAREEMLGVLGGIDAGRPTAWGQYGYKTELTFLDFLRAYERGGAGHGAVHRILDKCWQERPRIKQPGADKETAWETKVGTLLGSFNAWQKLRDFDRRNMVGRYAGLIYRVADGLPLSQPLVRATRLVNLIPVYEDQLRVSTWNSDPASEQFGEPTMWQYRTRRPGATDTQGAPDRWEDVHPSRVQIMAEGSVGDFFDGVPLLKAGFNHLVDLEKITGGSAESYLKNSARSLVFKFDANASPQVITQNPDGSSSGQTVREVVETQTRAMNRNQESAIVTQGADVTTLQTTLHDPQPSFEIAANMFAASVQIPYTILFGQQTGRLASDEDKADMIARCKSRQINELTPMLTELVTRLQAAGLVDAGEFEIEWPPLDAPGDKEKMELVLKMAEANAKNFPTGMGPTFGQDEMRKVAGFKGPAPDAPDPDLPGEGDPADDADPVPPRQMQRVA